MGQEMCKTCHEKVGINGWVSSISSCICDEDSAKWIYTFNKKENVKNMTVINPRSTVAFKEFSYAVVMDSQIAKSFT